MEARYTHHITTTYGKGDDTKVSTRRVEEKRTVSDDIAKLLAKKNGSEGENQVSSVTSSVSTKMSDAVYWGKGTWDKIPFSVEVFTSVTLQCPQEEDCIKMANSCAYDLAWKASRENIGRATSGHINDIQTRLCKGYFDDGET